MRKKVEGVLLSKRPFRERDLIARLLLRNGKRVDILFYAGQGGGKKLKSSLLQLGYLICVEINRVPSNHQGMYSSREYSIGWQHVRIQYSYQAFYLLCFYLELVAKIAPEDNLLGSEGGAGKGDYYGLFRVLSNSLFYLEKALAHREFSRGRSLALFLSKLIMELGITPNLNTCLYSNQRLCELERFKLLCDQGGFVAEQYLGRQEKGLIHNHRSIWEILNQSWSLSFKDMARLEGIKSCHFPSLYNYLLFHLGIDEGRIRTASLVI